MGNFDLLQGGMVTTCLVALPFLIVAIVFLFIALRNNQQARASMAWQSVQGTIGAAAVQARRSRSGRSGYSTAYYPELVYEYAVQGKKHVGERMTFGNPAGYGNRQRAQSIADRYAPGTQVTVYYNPQNPDDAVLERSAGTSSKILLWVGLLMILLVCIITLPTLFLLGGLSSFLDGFPLAK